MPFKSPKQRRYLWSEHPEIAQKWTDEYGSKPQPSKPSPKKRRLTDIPAK